MPVRICHSHGLAQLLEWIIANKNHGHRGMPHLIVTPAIRQPCEWGPDVAAEMHRMALSRFAYNNVGGQWGVRSANVQRA